MQLKKLKNVSNPEKKRKIIGNLFIKIFEREAKKYRRVKYLAQGTLYPDIIESRSSTGSKTSKIKSMFTAVYEKCKNNEVQLTSPTYAPEDLYRDNFDGANITIKMNQLGQFWSKVGNNRITRKQYDENFSDGRRRVRR